MHVRRQNFRTVALLELPLSKSCICFEARGLGRGFLQAHPLGRICAQTECDAVRAGAGLVLKSAEMAPG